MTNPLHYMPQMDSLRALAVVGVLIQHWFNPIIPFGSWGVCLFFVISGYLITHSIYRLREERLSLSRAAGIFFIRRSARLFPAYYLLVCIWIFGSSQVRIDWAWYVFYVSNFLLDARQQWIALTPSWSLSVEEQFYLVWFFLVFLIRAKWIIFPMILLVFVAPLARFFYALNDNHFGVYLPWANLDALIAGALLCIYELKGKKLPAKSIWLVPPIAFLLVISAVYKLHETPLGSSAIPLTVALISIVLIWQSRIGFVGISGRIMGQQAIIYIGKISYGIYLFHMLTNAIAANISKSSNPTLSMLFHGETYIGFIVHIFLTLAIAACSYHLFEVPIRSKLNRLTIRQNNIVPSNSTGVVQSET